MILGLFRPSPNEAVIRRLYAGVVAAARRPELFIEMGIADTFEGRFECLTLHAVLVLRRLRACEAPGPEMAQHLVDTIFRHFDRTLREMGVGDTTVPKRMKTLAEAFLGRGAAYAEALKGDPTALEATLVRNVGVAQAEPLTRYVEASIARLDALPLQGFIDGTVPFADPLATAEAAP